MRQELRHLRHTQAQGQGYSDDQQGTTVQVSAGQDIDPRSRNRTEHDHGRTTQHWCRHRLNHPGNAREQSQ
ncbi:hypothetical protein D3C85_1549860 [compost metagenome]